MMNSTTMLAEAGSRMLAEAGVPMYPSLQQSYAAMTTYRAGLADIEQLIALVTEHPELWEQIGETK